MNVGIVGAGAVARRAHIPTIKQIRGIDLIAISDPNENALRKVSSEFNIRKTYRDYIDLLEDPSIDIVDICSPTHTHVEVILEAIGRGKHVLVEKPLALSLADAIRISNELNKTSLKLCCIQMPAPSCERL